MGIRIRIEHLGQPFRLAPGRPERAGVVLEGEAGAPPRRVRLDLEPRDAFAVVGVRNLTAPLDVLVTVDDGALLAETRPPGRLPRGKWGLRLRVDDLVVSEKRWAEVAVDAQGAGALTLAVVPRRVRLTRPIEEFDPQVRAVIEGPSVIDTRPLGEWLRDERPQAPQARRKACLLNVLAEMRAWGLDGTRLAAGSSGPSLAGTVEAVSVVAADYVDGRVRADLLAAIDQARAARPNVIFKDLDVHATHRDRVLALARDQGFGGLTLESYRWAGPPSLQVVLGVPEGASTVHVAEIDIDKANPLQDVAGMIVHLGELFDEGLDHLALREQLVRGPAAPFLYYESVAGESLGAKLGRAGRRVKTGARGVKPGARRQRKAR